MSKTISMDNFKDLVEQLCVKIAFSGFNPEVVLYIEKAGKILGEPLAESLKIKSIGIKAKRPGRKIKRILAKYLFFIPKPILQKIKYLELKSNLNKINKQRNITLNNNIDRFKNILVFDDAIDSGETVKQVVEYIKNLNYEINIRIAVITTTTNSPVVKPDYTIYENTVCNFPWSVDSENYIEFLEKYGEYYK